MMGVGLGAGAEATVVRDWGLHREWRVERDRAHPERPACLVEIPWSAAINRRSSSEPDAAPAPDIPQPPAVRAGMRVTVVRREAMSEIHLYGTALATAVAGEKIAVRAGWDHAVVMGVVRGPGLVELSGSRAR
jgi:hypothetical protein